MSAPIALLPVAPALAGASAFAVLDAGDGVAGGTALLPVAADFTGCAGGAAADFTGSAAPLFGAAADGVVTGPLLLGLVDQTVLGPEPAAFDAESLPAVPEAAVDGLGTALGADAPAPLWPGFAGSAPIADGFVGSGVPGLAEVAGDAGGVSAGLAVAPLGEAAELPVAPGFTGSIAFGVSAGFDVALGDRALLPVEPGLAGAALGTAEPGLPEASPG